jgi:uncharacterized protein YbcC (UPF0753/DUF2309 family)
MKTNDVMSIAHDALNGVPGHGAAFNEHEVLHDLKHHLPAQAPLKDFIHHNTLHSFQKLKFHQAIYSASAILGYRVSLSLSEYRALYHSKQISEDILKRVIVSRKGAHEVNDWHEWKDKALDKKYERTTLPRIGQLRAHWKKQFKIDLDSMVHPLLFRTLCCYLDQGISMWSFPVWNKSFLTSLAELERSSFTSFFKTKRARRLLLENPNIDNLLKLVVGDESLYKQYLFDQQFAHQGWSGMVATVEDNPQTLLDQKKINLKELIIFELLLEIDALDLQFGENNWAALSTRIKERPIELFAEVPITDLDDITSIWQEAYEWTYYDEVLAGIINYKPQEKSTAAKTFQVLFCIDDRECSLRRYLERFDPACETFATPGFFTVEFFFKPEGGKFYTKLCPAPVTPKYLIKEIETKAVRETDIHFKKHTLSLFRGWLITQTLGVWSAFKLFINIFKPSMSPATASSFKHMNKFSKLTIENTDLNDRENELQVGFTIEEMTTRAEALLKSIGLIKDFAPIVYLIGHGSSSINNPHYAAYDCGACSGRAGSVNSRVMCFMINHVKVRESLKQKGIEIPTSTQFVGGLHDTTRDEVIFFDEDILSKQNYAQHNKNEMLFAKALDHNAKERSRRFESVNSHLPPATIHEKIRERSVSLFEPRPELNHATNTLCIVGKRDLTKGIFLDRRAFMNSYDYQIDPQGDLLFGIMKPLGPVCGGINLEYFFSRVDNQKLGAGTKLPHNVMGLFGVANGIDGDLRPGLPSQMIEVHDPIRLMIIVEHFPEIVLKTILRQAEMYEWFINEWVHLVAINPETKELSVFKEGAFIPYHPLKKNTETVGDLTSVLEENVDNLPVYLLPEIKP